LSPVPRLPGKLSNPDKSGQGNAYVH
jgi:hypothetical protein